MIRKGLQTKGIAGRGEKIVAFLELEGPASSSRIFAALQEQGVGVSLLTVKRTLRELAETGTLSVAGRGRSTVYSVSLVGKLLSTVDTHVYCLLDPDRRHGRNSYNFDLLSALTNNLFSASERNTLTEATAFYHERNKDVSDVLHRKELERFVIELSWKSSKIEGNTYTLLDTELLLREGILAPGHTKDEAQMILNHKKAFSFIYEHKQKYRTLSRANMEEVHRLLTGGLGVQRNVRTKPVGVLGSKYRPLDTVYQIAEAIEVLSHVITAVADPYAKALIALAGVSYIQPFEDGNKRTARLMANALLLAHGLAPLSYRGVDEVRYREATLTFYELNSIVAMKEIFVEQYDFAARTYLVGTR